MKFVNSGWLPVKIIPWDRQSTNLVGNVSSNLNIRLVFEIFCSFRIRLQKEAEISIRSVHSDFAVTIAASGP